MLVVAVGKRERNEVYKVAERRKAERAATATTRFSMHLPSLARGVPEGGGVVCARLVLKVKCTTNAIPPQLALLGSLRLFPQFFVLVPHDLKCFESGSSFECCNFIVVPSFF